MTTWHDEPFHVPRLRPKTCDADGSTAVIWAVTVPAMVDAKTCVAAPLIVSVPEKVSVVVGAVGKVGVVGVLVDTLSLQAPAASDPSAIRAARPTCRTVRPIERRIQTPFSKTRGQAAAQSLDDRRRSLAGRTRGGHGPLSNGQPRPI